MKDNYYRYWGKADPDLGGWHLLPHHSLDVAACALELLDARPDWRSRLVNLSGLQLPELRRWIGFFAAVHDLGKFAAAFQGLAPQVARDLGHTKFPEYRVRHDSLGWLMWRRKFATAFVSADMQTAVAVWIRAATGHHGQPPSLDSLANIANHSNPKDLDAAMSWVGACQDWFKPDLTKGSESDFELVSWWLAGFFTVADWLGSDAGKFVYRPQPVAFDEYFEYAQGLAKQAVDDAGLRTVPKPVLGFNELFPGYRLSAVQAIAESLRTDEPQLTIIEEATGGGKTEAALALAGGKNLFFGLPTQATANGLWARVRNSPSLSQQATLTHGGRWMVPGSMDYASAWLTDSTRRNLLADVCVGTIDQAALAVLHAKHAALRLVGLMGKTVIIDEAHAYDPYQRKVLTTLIERTARSDGSVIILSATLPKLHRREYLGAWAAGRGVPAPELQCEAYPLITHMRASGPLLEQPVETLRPRHVDTVEVETFDSVRLRVLDAVRCGQCVCWIRNTVRDAIDAYDSLRSDLNELELFHARFISADRAAIERRVLSRFGKESTFQERQGRVLIATQVVEQSLDLDFDLLISDLAPIDLLIQRAGRLHRHQRGSRGMPTMIVHAPRWSDQPSAGWVWAWGRGTGFVYPDHGRLWLSLRILRKHGGMALPQDARSLIEGVYGEGIEDGVPSSLQETTLDSAARAINMVGSADYHTVPATAAYEADGMTRWNDERAPTRLGAPVQEWILTCNGAPLSGSAAESGVKLYLSALSDGPRENRVKVAPWQRTLAMVKVGEDSWYVRGINGKGDALRVEYARDRGLVVVT